MNKIRRAVIVTTFDNYSYNVRVKYIEHCLFLMRYDVTILSADFDHRNKCHYSAQRANLELLHVPEYTSNMSFKRMYSHYRFAHLVYNRLREIRPDFIYGSTPPNFLVKYLAKYKKQFHSVKLVYEIGDLWPETLPLSGKIKAVASPFLYIWRILRDRYINGGDGVICECDLFQKVIGKSVKLHNAQTIYLCKENCIVNFAPKLIDGVLNFAYVGSINNIIDIDLIVDTLVLINKQRPVHFEIIGDGENAGVLFDKCEKAGIDYVNRGLVYDEQQKVSILSRCQFAFNIMKTSVMVGATMKSLEYFHSGLILINNIPADTAEIISKYGCGFNICKESVEIVSSEIAKLTAEDIVNMQKASRLVFVEKFDEKIITKQFKKYIESVCEKS